MASLYLNFCLYLRISIVYKESGDLKWKLLQEIILS